MILYKSFLYNIYFSSCTVSRNRTARLRDLMKISASLSTTASKDASHDKVELLLIAMPLRSKILFRCRTAGNIPIPILGLLSTSPWSSPTKSA